VDLPAASKTLHIHPPATIPSSGLLSSIKTLPSDHGNWHPMDRHRLNTKKEAY